MLNEQTPRPQEADGLREKLGHKTEIRFTFVRHSQKASGQVFAEGTQGLSASGISESGKQRAAAYGESQLISRSINKAYATEIDRTRETLASAFEAANINPRILQNSDTTQAFFSMPAKVSSEKFRQQYDAIMVPQRQQYIDEHYSGRQFDELTPDEQEAAAEYAEEPAIEWYLAFGDKRPDKETLSPREQAAAVAFKINRLVNLPDYMPNNRSVDLVSAGHKTSTEAFLKYVLERQKDGAALVGFDKLKEIGGSLKILDSWDLQVRDDEKGEKHVKIVLRRENGETQEFGLNVPALTELATEYWRANNLQPNKIDSLL